jgi:hypothetical protein
MPDITMCGDTECPMAVRCYRNERSGTKRNEYRQSWFAESPRVSLHCDYFWTIESSQGKEE